MDNLKFLNENVGRFVSCRVSSDEFLDEAYIEKFSDEEFFLCNNIQSNNNVIMNISAMTL